MRTTRIRTLLVACVVVAGCAPARLQPTLPRILPSAEHLLEILAVRRAAVTSLRSFAQVAYERRDEHVASRHAVVARRPDRLRLEVLSPLGVLALAASDGREFAVYVRREGRIYRGPATPASVAAYAAVPIAVPDVVAILLGSPPDRPPRGPAAVTPDERQGLIVLSVPIEAGRQQIWFAPDTLHPVASTTTLADGRTLRVTFGDYVARGALAFPLRIDLRAEPGGDAVHVEYGEPILNAEVADGLFAVPSMPGVDEYEIEQYSGEGAPS